MTKSLATRPDANEYAPYYEKYIHLVREGDIVETLGHQIDDTLALLRSLSSEQADSRYAADKWSIKEVIGHLTDTERIFAYRALRFGRNDPTPLSGFEQNDYVTHAAFSQCSMKDLADEFEQVRRASIHLFRHMPQEAWERSGVASGYDVTVRALAWMIAGHELHHLRVVRERYL
ncbi:MAG: DinB family protein [Acidobacteriota bacterium]